MFLFLFIFVWQASGWLRLLNSKINVITVRWHLYQREAHYSTDVGFPVLLTAGQKVIARSYCNYWWTGIPWWWPFNSWGGFRTKRFYCWGFSEAALVIMASVRRATSLQAPERIIGDGRNHRLWFKGVNHSSNDIVSTWFLQAFLNVGDRLTQNLQQATLRAEIWMDSLLFVHSSCWIESQWF